MVRLSQAETLYRATRSLSENAAKQVAVQVRLFAKWLGFDPPLKPELAPQLIAWIRHRQKTRSPSTARNSRRHILAIWQHAARLGCCEPPPEIPQVLGLAHDPMAWTIDQMRALLQAARNYPHRMPDGTSKGDYFACCLLVAWDTGLRRSDIWRLRKADVRENGLLLVAQGKTKQMIFCQFSPGTLKTWNQLAASKRETEAVLAWPFSDDYWADCWRRIARWAGLRPWKTFARIRAAAASYVELFHPGHAQRFLGHKTPGLAYRHYVDPRIAGQNPVRPPDLLDGDAA